MIIGYYSSSSPITCLSPKRFERSIAFLTERQIELVPGVLTQQQDFYRSGSIAERAEEINQLIYNDDVDIIMSTIGGTNTNSVLRSIDFDYLQQHPKILVGYSDTTAFLLAAYTKAPNCRIFYGPALVASFGEFPPAVDYQWSSFLRVLETPSGQAVTLQAPTHWTDERSNWETYQQAKNYQTNHWGYTECPQLEGILIGGNLNTMYGILGSPYFPEIPANCLLLLEDAEKTASIVEKNFSMLLNAGIFDQVSGIILGKHALFDDQKTGKKPVDILLEVLGERKLPIIYDYDSSHTVPMMTSPIGSYAYFDAQKMTVTFSDF